MKDVINRLRKQRAATDKAIAALELVFDDFRRCFMATTRKRALSRQQQRATDEPDAVRAECAANIRTRNKVAQLLYDLLQRGNVGIYSSTIMVDKVTVHGVIGFNLSLDDALRLPDLLDDPIPHAFRRAAVSGVCDVCGDDPEAQWHKQ
jgi:hypothetical protein